MVLAETVLLPLKAKGQDFSTGRKNSYSGKDSVIGMENYI